MGVLSTRERPKRGPATLLSRSLGGEMFVSAGYQRDQVLPGDVAAAGSDGLHNLATPPEMAETATRHAQLEDAAQELVDLAKPKRWQR